MIPGGAPLSTIKGNKDQTRFRCMQGAYLNY